MNLNIKIEIPPETQAKIRGLTQLPEELLPAIKRGMDRSLQIVAGRIVEKRLSGKGPFPPSQHRLGEVTGQLRRSVRAEPAVIAGNEVTGAIGTPVIYGRVHEFGATITPKAGKFLVFKIGDKMIFARKSVIPARAPFTTGVTENVPYIAGEIRSEIEKTLKDVGK